MLLFKPEHKPMILSGQKTVTRRFWKRRRAVPGAVHQACLALSGPGRKPFALLRILEVYQEHIGDITTADVRAEGYASRKEYFSVLHKINSKRLPFPDEDGRCIICGEEFGEGIEYDHQCPEGFNLKYKPWDELIPSEKVSFLAMKIWVVRFKVEEVCGE